MCFGILLEHVLLFSHVKVKDMPGSDEAPVPDSRLSSNKYIIHMVMCPNVSELLLQCTVGVVLLYRCKRGG